MFGGDGKHSGSTSVLSFRNTWLRWRIAYTLSHGVTRHPGYTVNSKLRKLQLRPIAKPAVFTAGYEGLSVDAFINLFIENGVRRLVDIRRNPVARRYGFHRSTLNRLCGYLEIEYVHEPDLGIASEKRRGLVDFRDYEALFSDYEKTTLIQEQYAIDRVTSLVQEKPSVLVCMEADPICCHRLRLAKVIAERSGLPIRHLGTADGCRTIRSMS